MTTPRDNIAPGVALWVRVLAQVAAAVVDRRRERDREAA